LALMRGLHPGDGVVLRVMGARAVELIGVGAAEGLSRERMQGIALATRKAKP
jgi:hypothetical protein